MEILTGDWLWGVNRARNVFKVSVLKLTLKFIFKDHVKLYITDSELH